MGEADRTRPTQCWRATPRELMRVSTGRQPSLLNKLHFGAGQLKHITVR